jgi:hypothetical protein
MGAQGRAEDIELNNVERQPSYRALPPLGRPPHPGDDYLHDRCRCIRLVK